jgi:CspA family cold shock protein
VLKYYIKKCFFVNNIKEKIIMQTGIVNRFNKIKGYGFITPDNGGAEVFVHFSQVQIAGYKELKIGQKIRYHLEAGERGEFATKVEITL